jgi:excisionase family DNA binding protein
MRFQRLTDIPRGRCCNCVTSQSKRADTLCDLGDSDTTRGGAVDTGDRLLTPGEVAALFRVDPKTVTRWAAAGRIGSIRTPGGHRRFRESEVRALLEGDEVLEEMREDDAANRPRNAGPSDPGTRGPGNGLR